MTSKIQFGPFAFWESAPALVSAYVPDKSIFVITENQILFSYASPTEESPTKALYDRLNDLKIRHSQPYFPNSKTPRETAFQDARDFILKLPLMRIAKPSINIASDGEVNFEWKGSDFKIDLGFYGNQKFSYYAVKNGLAPLLGDDIPVNAGPPEELLSFAAV